MCSLPPGWEKYESCILFVDLINSSAMSTFMGLSDFLKWIINFQKQFEDLAKYYFKDWEPLIKSAGDEGHFIITIPMNKKEHLTELLFKTICFALEFKVLMKLPPLHTDIKDVMPHGIQLAIGIHSGVIAGEYVPDKGKVSHKRFIGYNINYAKRIETCSREGLYTNIFVSNEVYEILNSRKPLFFEEHKNNMKGISKSAVMYEVRSIFIADEVVLFVGENEKLNSSLLEEIITPKLFHGPSTRNEKWFHIYCFSLLYQLKSKSHGDGNKEYYTKLFIKELFKKIEPLDPLIEFIKALHYCDQNDNTLAIEKLQSILNQYPGFIYAKIILLETLDKVLSNTNRIPYELLQIVNSTTELLKYHSKLLSTEEKEILEDISKNANSELKKIKNKKKSSFLKCLK